MTTKHLAILFCVVFDTVEKPFSDVIKRFAGTKLKTIGGAFIFGFTDEASACGAALELQKIVQTKQKEKKEAASWRAGISAGKVTVRSNDVFGEAVNLAARLEGISGSGEIFVSEQVRQAIASPSFKFSDLGTQTIKGMEQPVHVFALGNVVTKKEVAPVSPKKTAQSSSEMFDFSRVEQERIQETNIMSLSTPRPDDIDAPIPLAEHEKKEEPELIKTPTSPQPLFYKSRTKDLFLSKAKVMLLIWSGLIPVALIGTGWGYALLQEGLKRDEKESEKFINEKLESSEALKALRTKRPDASTTSEKKKPYGSLVIRTTPRNVDIFVEGRKISSVSPVRVKKVPANQLIQVKIRKFGYQEIIEAFNLQPDEEREIVVHLKKAP